MNPYRVPELTITPLNDGTGRFHFCGKLSSIQINDSNYAALKTIKANQKEGGGVEESKESEDDIIQRILTYNPGATKRNITAHLEDKFQKEVAAAATPVAVEQAAAPPAEQAASPQPPAINLQLDKPVRIEDQQNLALQNQSLSDEQKNAILKEVQNLNPDFTIDQIKARLKYQRDELRRGSTPNTTMLIAAAKKAAKAAAEAAAKAAAEAAAAASPQPPAAAAAAEAAAAEAAAAEAAAEGAYFSSSSSSLSPATQISPVLLDTISIPDGIQWINESDPSKGIKVKNKNGFFTICRNDCFNIDTERSTIIAIKFTQDTFEFEFQTQRSRPRTIPFSGFNTFFSTANIVPCPDAFKARIGFFPDNYEYNYIMLVLQNYAQVFLNLTIHSQYKITNDKGTTLCNIESIQNSRLSVSQCCNLFKAYLENAVNNNYYEGNDCTQILFVGDIIRTKDNNVYYFGNDVILSGNSTNKVFKNPESKVLYIFYLLSRIDILRSSHLYNFITKWLIDYLKITIDNILNHINTLENEELPTSFPSITIDGINFTLLSKKSINLTDNRYIILYKVNEILYTSYKSHSDVNWRVSLLNHGHYEKGNDYVTTTQVHQHLQCFFNEKFTILHEMSELVYTCIMKHTANIINDDEEFQNRIVKAGEYTHDVFEPLKICVSGECFTNRTSYDIKTAFSAFKYNNPTNIYTTYMTQQIDAIKTNNPTLFNKDILNTNESEHIQLYKLIVQVFSTYMQHFFTIIGSPTFICDRLAKVPYSVHSKLTQSINIKIYELILQLNDSDIQFKLYYGTYTYKPYKTGTISDSPISYKIILNLVLYNSRIIKYGLYDKYISAGIYLYKMFEYHSPRTQVAYSDNQIPGDYTFIGDLLTNMWPLQDVHEPSVSVAPPPPAATVGAASGGAGVQPPPPLSYAPSSSEAAAAQKAAAAAAEKAAVEKAAAAAKGRKTRKRSR